MTPHGVDDAEAMRCVVAQFHAKFEAANADTLPALRCQHAKSHGCVDADLIVARGVPIHLQKGLFAHENARYPALIRFSSAPGRPKPDTRRAAHGMAIKVFVPVVGEDRTVTQDFILSSHPVFPIRNAVDYCPFSQLLVAKPLAKVRKFLRLVLPPDSHLLDFWILLRSVVQRISNPLTTRYWSQTPYKLGDDAIVKYFASPVQPRIAARLLSRDNPLFPRARGMYALLIGSPERNHALEDAMVERLAPAPDAQPARFRFQVQLYKDPDTTPIEDPRKEWNSPFHTVAWIEIPAQRFNSQRRRNAAEALTFTPKHTLPEHAPLGAINRVRVEVYDKLAERRHKINGVDGSEPRSRDEWLSPGAARVPP